jgi:hypothetical protein
VKKLCRYCGTEFKPLAKTGRPAVFCSAGCLAASTHEVRRLCTAISSLEEKLRWQRDPANNFPHAEHAAFLETELAKDRQALRELLSD